MNSKVLNLQKIETRMPPIPIPPTTQIRSAYCSEASIVMCSSFSIVVC